jgi:hypothetical protein
MTVRRTLNERSKLLLTASIQNKLVCYEAVPWANTTKLAQVSQSSTLLFNINNVTQKTLLNLAQITHTPHNTYQVYHSDLD